MSWGSKKQYTIELSTEEAEYIAATVCCAQLFWFQQHVSDYGLTYGCVPILCDNTSAINISKNPVQHAIAKHIEIRLHFLKDCVDKKIVSMNFIGTNDQLADIFTKALNRKSYESVRLKLEMISLN